MVRWGLYPFVLLVTFALDHLFRLLGFSPWISAYASVVIGCLWLISRLERLFPHSREWFASAVETRLDLQFLLWVAVLLPMALSLGIAALSSQWVQSSFPSALHLWPRGLLPWQQVALMIVLADPLRYWLHRFCHGWPSLWRLHVIHHAVCKLNVLNTGRFHPLETSLQFLCETAPFILLGVSEEVLSFYFVLHASKAFLQHSNLDIRLGLLNRLISGPELHRLHHSLDPDQHCSNFGNKLSVWDQIWGTYLDPSRHTVTTLGVVEGRGQAPFVRQLMQPFLKMDLLDSAGPGEITQG